MRLTVSDLLSFDCFRSLRLIAGRGGLQQAVSGCGILDYELEASLKGKYLHTNFYPGQLAVSSLFFAKNNPFLIRDAVKYLVSRGGSGLLIKNVFRLPLHDAVLRYADAKDFPILLIDDGQAYFEELIIQIDRYLRAAEDLYAAEELLGRLYYEKMDGAEKKAAVRQLLPNFHDEYLVAFLRTGELVPEHLLQEAGAQAKGLFPFPHRVFRWRKGVVLLLSRDTLCPEELSPAVQALADRLGQPAVGLSSVHFAPEELDHALRQAVQAAAVHALGRDDPLSPAAPLLHYRQLGVYRLLLPLIDQEALGQYAGGILEPLLEFDAENRGNLLETLLHLVRCGGDLHLLARYTGQHENTLRNRLERIRGLTGLNYRRPGDYEELALAARIYLLRNVEG
ncbi:MAG: PucR family transcriptional regulator [Oscillospiraceae bacterium]|jgi:hypothetical protein|nr:PucR family transcriptional regulator [Oscillospiraceae bacterium]